MNISKKILVFLFIIFSLNINSGYLLAAETVSDTNVLNNKSDKKNNRITFSKKSENEDKLSNDSSTVFWLYLSLFALAFTAYEAVANYLEVHKLSENVVTLLNDRNKILDRQEKILLLISLQEQENKKLKEELKKFTPEEKKLENKKPEEKTEEKK